MSDEENVNSVRTGRLRKAILSADEGAVVNLTPEEAKGLLSGDPAFANLASQVMAERNKRLAPPGSLNLPELLDQRRIEYAIPNSVFEMQPLFDKVVVFQIPEDENPGTYGDTSIVMPDTHQEKRAKESPVGILCAAGLEAMDVMRTHGIALGHKVSIVKLHPWRKEVESVMGHRYEQLIVQVGDLIGSVDLAEALQSGEARIEWSREAKGHVYVDSDGVQWTPRKPETAPEI